MESSRKQFTYVGAVLLLSLLVGSLSGVIASVFTERSLDQYLLTLREGEELVRISQVKPRPLPGTYEEALSRVQEDGWKALASVRAKSVDSKNAADWFTANDALGTGAIVANDGWVVFHKDAFATFTNPEQQAEIWIAETRYVIEQYVEDDLSQLVMVKVNARDLPTLAFGASNSVTGGEMMFALPGTTTVAISNVLNAHARTAPLILPAEQFEAVWELTSVPVLPSPLFNSGAELVGFVGTDVFAEPLHYGTAFIQGVLRNETAVHAALGAFTLNIDAAQNIDPSLIGSARSGALLVRGGRNRVAVLSNGPAAQAGLREGDIIVSVDGVVLSVEETLAEQLAGKRPGATVTLSILREGETRSVPLTLGDFKDFAY